MLEKVYRGGKFLPTSCQGDNVNKVAKWNPQGVTDTLAN